MDGQSNCTGVFCPPGCPEVAGKPKMIGGKMLILVGPGGSGKTTLANAFCEHHGFTRWLSFSTRAPRPAVKVPEYLHVHPTIFGSLLGSGWFVEVGSAASGTLYGFPWPAEMCVPEKMFAAVLAKSRPLVAITSAVGAGIVRERLAPEWDVRVMLVDATESQLLARLRKRKDSEIQIRHRMKLAPLERRVLGGADWRIEADTVKRAQAMAVAKVMPWLDGK